MPPVSGNAPATSARVSAPQSATTPPATHTPNKGRGPGSRFAIPAGVRKMPEPMVMPMTTATALQRPSCRGSVPDVEREDGSVIPNATPGRETRESPQCHPERSEGSAVTLVPLSLRPLQPGALVIPRQHVDDSALAEA